MSEPSTLDVQANLPPPRKKPGMKPVSPPLSNVSLSQFLYILGFLGLLMSAFYTYRLVSYKNDAGGWVNLALGKSPSQPIITTSGIGPQATVGSQLSLEAKMRDLADELGIHPRELASAIKPLLPAATSASISSAGAKATGGVVGVLAEADAADGAPSVMEKVAGLGGLVGNEEPFMDDA